MRELAVNSVEQDDVGPDDTEVFSETSHDGPPECHRCGESGHNGDNCPHFAQERDMHGDAWTHFLDAPALEQGAGDNIHLIGASVERQPGDGHCLFHSLAAGLAVFGEHTTGATLREERAGWIWTNNEVEQAGKTSREWM